MLQTVESFTFAIVQSVGEMIERNLFNKIRRAVTHTM